MSGKVPSYTGATSNIMLDYDTTDGYFKIMMDQHIEAHNKQLPLNI